MQVSANLVLALTLRVPECKILKEMLNDAKALNCQSGFLNKWQYKIAAGSAQDPYCY